MLQQGRRGGQRSGLSGDARGGGREAPPLQKWTGAQEKRGDNKQCFSGGVWRQELPWSSTTIG
jgi:hypothetical protein